MAQQNESAPVASARLIVTLVAEAGQKYDETGECVGAYSPDGSRYSSIVFLPKGPKPGDKVRLELLPIKDVAGQERTDKRGNVMYRSRPAPVEYLDHWRETAAGELECYTIAINWLLAESEEGVVETRPKASREQASTPSTEFLLIWGQDQASSVVRRVTTPNFILEQEAVSEKHALVWKRTGTRQGTPTTENFPLLRWRSVMGGNFWSDALQVAHDPKATLTIEVAFRKQSGEELNHFSLEWGQLPAWLQDELLKPYPVCACGRQRRDPPRVTDGYDRCDLCRAEERCDRCGKQPVRVTILGGRKICAACPELERLEGLVHQYLPPERRLQLDADAEQLLSSQVVDPETAIMLLEVLLGHLPQAKRAELLQQWSGYAHYYFGTNSGVFGSKFGLEALQILAHLDQAAGNGLVNLVAWISGRSHKTAWLTLDYYHRTQEKGESLFPSFSSSDLAQASLAVKLLGSYASRQEAVSRYNALVEKIGADAAQLGPATAILHGDAQDYAAALEELKKVERIIALRERGEVMLNFTVHSDTAVAVICADGTLRPSDTQEYLGRRNGTNHTWAVIEPDELVLSWRDDKWNPVFTVVKRPVDGITEAQLAAVRKLEADNSLLPDSFGVDAESAKLRDQRLRAIKLAAQQALGRHIPTTELTYRAVVSKNGVPVFGEETRHDVRAGQRCGYLPDAWQRRIVTHDRGGAFPESCDDRDAQVVHSVPTFDGALEFLAYHKYGRWNLAMRWRPQRPEEVAPPVAASGNEVTDPGRTEASQFTYKPQRHWLCRCGSTFKMPDTEWHGYRNGRYVTITCPKCMASDTVHQKDISTGKPTVPTGASQPLAAPMPTAPPAKPEKSTVDLNAFKKGFKLGGA